MCVIMVPNKVRPTEEMIERAWKSNPDGAGIAWRENDSVVFQKGIMEIDEIKALCAKVPTPYTVHFRVASVGGVKPSLTHPFLVGPDASLELKGRTKGAVLFHNGHWSPWNEKGLDAAIHSNNKIPEGSDWSDSRMMAWMVHIYGPGLMELLPQQKGVLMTPRKFNIFTGGGWEKINDIWCSNDYFWKGGSRHRGTTGGYHGFHGNGRICSVGRCHEPAQAGKDMCEKCEKALKDTTGGKTDEGNKSVGQSQPSPVAIVTGGTTRPLAKAFTMAEVEGFYKRGQASKSQLKKYRKAHGAALGARGNKALRAIKQMQDLSEDIAERWMNGLTH